MRPVSKMIRWAVGAFTNSAAIAAAEVAALASRATLPSRSITQICVSFIEISKPAKYSMGALLLSLRNRSYRLRGEQPPHYPMLQKSFGYRECNIDSSAASTLNERFKTVSMLEQSLRCRSVLPTFATLSALKRLARRAEQYLLM